MPPADDPGASEGTARSGANVIGVLGEILITAGVLVFLYLAWLLWFNDGIVGGQQVTAAQSQSRGWAKADQGGNETGSPDPAIPTVGKAPANAVQFANIIVPRFGADYQRPISEGVGTADSLRVGVGHYPGSQMPGGIGNVALAGHRTTWGAPFGQIADLRVGDSIYIETKDGWYRYVFRSLEFVRPTGVSVLDPVPDTPGVTARDRVLTMTSCNPKFSAAERIIAFSVFDTWYPRADGPPPEIASAVEAH
ncbi:MAG: class E sortase [Salinibacterium sp.]|nr:MAG: class E sortase [Salinibacterium sp.]